MKNILIPTDFSKNGTDAFNYGVNFFGDEEVHFHIVHVVVPVNESVEYPSMTSVANQAILDAAKNNLKNFKESVVEHGELNAKIKITEQVLLGQISSSILDAAKSVDADLIIMGTSGKGKSNLQKFLGSVSAELISNAKIPVLLIPKDFRFKLLENVVYASDLDKSDPFNIWKFSKLIRPNSAVIQCLHVIKEKSEKNEALIKEFSEFLSDNTNNIQTRFFTEVSDDVEEAISDFADNYEAEMIVMHRSSKSFWDRIFGKRHTKRMVYQLDIPLMVI